MDFNKEGYPCWGDQEEDESERRDDPDWDDESEYFEYQSFTNYETKIVDEQVLTQLEIVLEQIKLCKMFDYKTNNQVIDNFILKLSKALEKKKQPQNLADCKQIAFQICYYVFTHQVKFSECENVKKLFDYVSKENNLFNLKQKNQLKKQFNSIYEHELFDDEEFGDEGDE